MTTTAAVLTAAATVHIGMVFLHVAPANVASKRYAEQINDYISPEFTQNWKLFAPEPMHRNRATHARAELASGNGATRTTGWVNISDVDTAGITGNPLPSHVRDQLRKAWSLYSSTHEGDHATSRTGNLAERWLKRIALLRLDHELDLGAVRRIQIRSATTPVAEPAWSDKETSTETDYDVLPWWTATENDIPDGGGR